jgi:tRNA (adenine-N(1)-)-methyltransferase non-catalytic subunit
LIGETYGLTYEIADKKLKRIPQKIIQEVGKTALRFAGYTVLDMPTEDTDATNELINDGQFVQPLTLEEIEALKQSGAHSSVRKTGLPFSIPLMNSPLRKLSRNR